VVPVAELFSMLNWGDKEAADRLSVQLRELLRDRVMTYDQLASVYSIRNGQSVTQKLKEMSRDRRPMLLGDFIEQMSEHFEVAGKNQVRARVVRAAEVVRQEDAREEERVVMKYADVSRAVQNILKEHQEPLAIGALEELFLERHATNIEDIVGMTTEEYLQRKDNIFDFNQQRNSVFLQSSVLVGPPMADSSTPKDEHFVVSEFEQLIEAMGPVVYISTLCGKFIQRNNISVTSIISTRPLDLFKRHPSIFLIVGAGNVTLKKYEHVQEVQRLLDKPASKAQRIAKAAEEAQLPVPEIVSEEHVVQEFRRLILNDGTDSVYISSLCGRFLQRFKKPVTTIINCKPAELLRRYPDIFVMTGGGNVGLREVLGPDAVSVPPPPPRVPKALRDESTLPNEMVERIQLTAEVYHKIHARITTVILAAVVRRIMVLFRQIESGSFLALEEVVLGGAAGKGLLTSGPAAEIVLVVRQLPLKNFGQWLPHIFETLVATLEFQLKGCRPGSFKVERDHINFTLVGDEGPEIPLQVYVAPSVASRESLIGSIRAAPPAERFYFYPSMAKQRNEFIGRQTSQTKLVIRLVTWWSSKQTWSTSFSTPSDWLLELVVVHTCLHPDNVNLDLPELMDCVLCALAKIEVAKVTWTDIGVAAYELDEIWKPLLTHEPLVMDPLNPYCNVADVNNFDAHELVAAAQQSGRLGCFTREAAQFLSLHEEECEDDEY